MNNKSSDNKESVPAPSSFIQLILTFVWPPDTVKKKIAVAIVIILVSIFFLVQIFILLENRKDSELKPTLQNNSSTAVPDQGTTEIERNKQQPQQEHNSSTGTKTSKPSETEAKEVKQWPDKKYNK